MKKLEKVISTSENFQTLKNLINNNQVKATINNTICQASFLEIGSKKTHQIKRRESKKHPTRTINKNLRGFEKQEEVAKL